MQSRLLAIQVFCHGILKLFQYHCKPVKITPAWLLQFPRVHWTCEYYLCTCTNLALFLFPCHVSSAYAHFPAPVATYCSRWQRQCLKQQTLEYIAKHMHAVQINLLQGLRSSHISKNIGHILVILVAWVWHTMKFMRCRCLVNAKSPEHGLQKCVGVFLHWHCSFLVMWSAGLINHLYISQSL